MSIIVRSMTTGTYHKGSDNSHSIRCNYSGQARRMTVRVAQPSEIIKASNGAFCKKCFPEGKPEASA